MNIISNSGSESIISVIDYEFERIFRFFSEWFCFFFYIEINIEYGNQNRFGFVEDFLFFVK